MKLWRKSGICDGNCDGKTVRHLFVTNIIVTDPSQFVTSNGDGKLPVTIICDGKIVTVFFPSQLVCDKNCDGQYKTMTDVVTEDPSQFWKEELHTRRFFCDRRENCDGIRHNFVTDWSLSVTNWDGMVRFRHKLWRISVTIHFLWWNSVTNSVTMF